MVFKQNYKICMNKNLVSIGIAMNTNSVNAIKSIRIKNGIT